MMLWWTIVVLFSVCWASEPPAHQCCRLISPGLRGLNYASLNRKKRSFTVMLREFLGIKKSATPYLELDFNAKYSYIDMDHEVKIYRPELFAKLRERIGISDDYYINCLNANNLQCLSSDSKSGQAFWMSNDGSIVLKTLKHYELCNLRNILDHYYEHLVDSASCIASILGIYRVITKNGHTKYFMVSRNIFPALNSGQKQLSFDSNVLVKKYDFKGSTVGRRASPTSSVMKDLDFMESGNILKVGPTREFLLQVLERDVQFLSHYKFMDYSLLVAETTYLDKFYATHNRGPQLSVRVIDYKGKLVLRGDNGKIYYFGIIDFLQQYTYRKALETWLKGLVHDATKVSCVNPVLYARRLIAFINKYTSPM